MRDADFGPIGDVRTEVFTTNFPDDAFNANGGCIGRFISRAGSELRGLRDRLRRQAHRR